MCYVFDCPPEVRLVEYTDCAVALRAKRTFHGGDSAMAVHVVPTDYHSLSQLIDKLEGDLPRSNSVRNYGLCMQLQVKTT